MADLHIQDMEEEVIESEMNKKRNIDVPVDNSKQNKALVCV